MLQNEEASSKRIRFTKMHGCGNDYIYINCFETEISSPEALAITLSDRHKGIGGDGIILILPSEIADAKMRIFNIDGSEGNMCGNGIRCVAKYIYDNGICDKTHMRIETKSGVREMDLITENGLVSQVRVNMGTVKAKKTRLGDADATYVDVGNPHCVLFRDRIDVIDIAAENYEKNEAFPDGVNTEFVEVVGENELKMRVWERGSGETQACGTGACASAVAAVLNGYCEMGADIKVRLLGGNLVINYDGDKLYMTGECVTVFEGTVEV